MPSASASLSEIAALGRPIVERIVWCTVASAGPEGPRARLMHPVWWWHGDRPRALVTARPTPIKVRHLDHLPVVSCSYWDPAHETVVIDAVARWVAASERAAAWDAVKAVDPPVGFDPTVIWPEGPGAPDCRFLELTATRIVVTATGVGARRWSAPTP